MDASHYDKIADKLIQFHSKLPQDVDLESRHAKCQVENMKYVIASMLRKIDELANSDERGWLR
jgi:archaellum component FlaC